MDPILYNAAGGGRVGFGRQEVIANNLANVNTPGFRADLYQAQTMYMQEGGSGPAFTSQSKHGVDFTPGNIVSTGRNLDVAINHPNGWFAVHDNTGKESYTKAGSFQVGSNGQLVTASGKPVLGNGGPISIPPAKSIDVGSDGTISIIPLGGETNAPSMIDRIKMVTLDKGTIVKGTEGLFQLKDGSTAPVDNNLKLVSGALEGSNVQPVEQMIAMISAGRDFETHMNLMTTVGENLQKLAGILHD